MFSVEEISEIDEAFKQCSQAITDFKGGKEVTLPACFAKKQGTYFRYEEKTGIYHIGGWVKGSKWLHIYLSRDSALREKRYVNGVIYNG